jgi:Ala-tRNA(Pro) deacylase
MPKERSPQEGSHMPRKRLTEILDEQGVAYEVIHHPPDYSALEAAHDTHTPGAGFVKAVVMNTKGGPVLAVLPAPAMVDLRKFAEVVGCDEVRLASENAIALLFPDCQIGAEPPFGQLYDMPVFLDESLAGEEFITFNAGTHDEAIRIRFADYDRLEEPTHARFSRPR